MGPSPNKSPSRSLLETDMVSPFPLFPFILLLQEVYCLEVHGYTTCGSTYNNVYALKLRSCELWARLGLGGACLPND